MHYNVGRNDCCVREAFRMLRNDLARSKRRAGKVKAFILYRELTFKYATNRNWNDPNICFSFSSVRPSRFVRIRRSLSGVCSSTSADFHRFPVNTYLYPSLFRVLRGIFAFFVPDYRFWVFYYDTANISNGNGTCTNWYCNIIRL